MKKKMFRALTHNFRPIITVFADTEEEAQNEIRIELNKNASRRMYYDTWKKGGRMVVEYDPFAEVVNS